MHSLLTEENVTPLTESADLQHCFDSQRQSFLQSETESREERKQHLLNLKRMITENREAIIEAISADYGNRSRHETLFAEIITANDGIIDSIKHLKSWMKVQRRKVDQSMYPGGKARVIPQPLGVVGMIIPWNFPINLTFSQLAAVFAAGNRAMVKMSENSIGLSRLLNSLAPKYFDEDKLKFFEETGGVGIEFSKLPFDHLIFTGSGQTGRAVMAAAAANLTPVTLELGGKAPAVIAPDYPMVRAVERIMFVKQFNAGQICTNVDYVFVHEGQVDDFVGMAKEWAKKHCPDISSDDYTSIIDDRSFQRVSDTLDDARDKGATVINLQDQAPQAEGRKFPVCLVLNTTEEMTIRRREIFGPLLPVLPYRDPEEVIEYVNARDRPLALYPFTNDKELAARYIDRIMSGGVTVNDALFHVAQHNLPFGGVGPSGMGHYHGYEGFITFSKLRPVYYQPAFSAAKFLAPPYGKFADRMLGFLANRKK
ncbi:MAG: coniferyl aldehyde dehydrogenase [Gammaproteobacteria bacterium]|nr:coniferyl aldehyde dehydrogenase [Gammaproteobacteria bacterium]MDH3577555.1 coniferyl aldehyde dehydrogenase [Gammaproteobacteria bacterium]